MWRERASWVHPADRTIPTTSKIRKRKTSKKKRGSNRKSITLGGIKKIDTKNKETQRVNTMLGNMGLPASGKDFERALPPPKLNV